MDWNSIKDKLKEKTKGVESFITKHVKNEIPKKCVVCDEYIIAGQYTIDSRGQVAHIHHKLEFCTTCGGIIGKNEIRVSENRVICELCNKTVVKTEAQVKWVEQKVRSIYKNVAIGEISQKVKIKIVTPQELMKLFNQNTVNISQKGLTISQETAKGIFDHNIYVLDYLPKVFFAGVLAHEMLHVWQNEKYLTPSPKVTEGFCNLGSYIVYKDIDNALANILIKQLEADPDPVYGEGFRTIKNTFEKKGLQYVINKIKTFK